LTSIDLQKASWLDKENTNPHWSFVEFICCYFDDLALDDNYKSEINEGFVSIEEYNLIRIGMNHLTNILKVKRVTGKPF
jgi:hypothetical protein